MYGFSDCLTDSVIVRGNIFGGRGGGLLVTLRYWSGNFQMGTT